MELMQGKRFFIRRVFGFTFFLISIWSCRHEQERVVHYSFNNVNVSRYDYCKKTYLYAGYCNNVDSIKTHVSVVIDWGFDDFLMASMIFHENGGVELISGGGGEFKKVGMENLIFFKEYKPKEYAKIIEQFSGLEGNKNLCDLSDNLDLEKKKNSDNKSYITISEKPAAVGDCK